VEEAEVAVEVAAVARDPSRCPSPSEEHNSRIFFFGIVAFLAGFGERFTGVVFGGAERLISGDLGDAGASDGRGQVDGRGTTPAEPPAEARAAGGPAPDRS
jgi:hypothetical protein